MASPHRLQKLFGNFKGLDKRSSDLTRTSEFATEINNAVYRSSGAISKRKGYHGATSDTLGGYGMYTYKNIDIDTGAVTEEILTVDSELRKLNTANVFPIAYSGSEAAWYSMYLDPATSTFKFNLQQDGQVEQLSVDLQGKTLQYLATAIAAWNPKGTGAEFSVTLSVDIQSKLADYLPVTGLRALTIGGTTNLQYNSWETVTTGDGTTKALPAYALVADSGKLNDSELENASFAQLNDVVYISNGYDHVMKYDGSKIYRAGLPNGGDGLNDAEPDVTAHGSGSNLEANKQYDYKIQFEYTDAKGNYITSQPSKAKTYTQGGNAYSSRVKISTYNSTFFAGFDTSSAFAADHAVYPNQKKIKINIYRTKAYATGAGEVPGQFYLVKSVPYDALQSSGSAGDLSYFNTYTSGSDVYYLDEVSDADLSNFTVLPAIIKRHDPPPKGKYLAVFQNCLVIAGQRENVNNLQFSSTKNTATGEIGSEYFPDDDNGSIIESKFGDKITAIAPLKDTLYIFHKSSIHTLSGDITSPEGISYKIDLLTAEGGIGCESHNAIEEIRSNLFFLSETGIYSINTSQAYPSEVSAPIQPEFKKLSSSDKHKAVAFNWVAENVLLFIIPTETLANDKYHTSSSKIFIYDTSKEAWLQWSNVDFTGGISMFDKKLNFISRKSDGNNYLYQMQDSGSTYDYVDHNEAISFTYKTNWESVGEPTIPKKFLRLKLYSMDSEDNFESPAFSMDVKIQRNYVKDDVGTIAMDFAGASAGGWGVAEWGTSTWGSISLSGLKTKLPSGKTRALLLNFENKNVNENVLLSGYELEIVTPYGTEIKE